MLVINNDTNREKFKDKSSKINPKCYYSSITLIDNKHYVFIFVFIYIDRKMDI